MRPPLRPDADESPDPARLAADDPFRDEILARHRAAIEAGHDMYVDPRSGMSVMTAATLAARGWCCESGCRHCPYTGTTDKAEWRLWARSTVAGVDIGAASSAVRDHLRPVLAALAAEQRPPDGGRADRPRRILVYRALPGEIDLGALVDELGPQHFALSRTPERGPLTLHRADGPLEQHRFGFDQPLEAAPPVGAGEIALALVPGLAFDRRGIRLGHGAGFFDRLLAGFAPGTTLIGVAPAALVVPELPAEDHDVPMTHLVTEHGLTALGPTR